MLKKINTQKNIRAIPHTGIQKSNLSIKLKIKKPQVQPTVNFMFKVLKLCSEKNQNVLPRKYARTLRASTKITKTAANIFVQRDKKASIERALFFEK